MDVRLIDGYLLDGRPAKGDVVAAALATADRNERAAPFLRGLRAIGARAADETLVALRLVIAGRAPDDTAVRRLRSLAALVRDPGSAERVFARDGEVLADLAGRRDDPAALASAARAAYTDEVNGEKPL